MKSFILFGKLLLGVLPIGLITPWMILNTGTSQGSPIIFKYDTPITKYVFEVSPTQCSGGFSENKIYSCPNLAQWGDISLDTSTGWMHGSLGAGITTGSILVLVEDAPNESGMTNTAEAYIEINVPYSAIQVANQKLVVIKDAPFVFNIGISGGEGEYIVTETNPDVWSAYKLKIDNFGTISSDSGCPSAVVKADLVIGVCNASDVDHPTSCTIVFACIEYTPTPHDTFPITTSTPPNSGSFAMGFYEFVKPATTQSVSFDVEYEGSGAQTWSTTMTDPDNFPGLKFDLNTKTLTIDPNWITYPESFLLTVSIEDGGNSILSSVLIIVQSSM